MMIRINNLSVLFVAALVLALASSAQAVTWSSFDVTSSHGILDGGTVVSALNFGGTNNSPTLEIGSTPTNVLFTYDGANPSPKNNGGGWGNGPAGFPGTDFRTFLNNSTFGNTPATITLGPTTAGNQYRLQLITYDGGSLGGTKDMFTMINDDGDTGFSANRVTANDTLAKVFMAEWTSTGVANLIVTLDDAAPNEFDWQITGLLLQDLTPTSATPEPSTAILAILGLVGFAGLGRRRRNRA